MKSSFPAFLLLSVVGPFALAIGSLLSITRTPPHCTTDLDLVRAQRTRHGATFFQAPQKPLRSDEGSFRIRLQSLSMQALFHLPCKRLEVDEIWAFCYAKAKNVPAAKKGTFGYGDVWTFAAIDADSMRMSIRRFTRLTNAFSKKVENHTAPVAVHFFHYNFVRPHMSLKGKPPVQASGVDARRWTVEDMIRLLPDSKD